MKTREYWKECISVAADDHGIVLSPEQIDTLAESVEGGHENYGMAFYSPPSSDRLNTVEREWKGKLDKLTKEFEAYRHNAETAVKQALKQHREENVSIGEHGEVFRHGGRTEQIQ